MEESNFLSSKARAQNFNPPVDMRLLDYVTPYDENLMCAICRCPFLDPVVLAECDHCFCRDCIRQTWTSAYNPLGPRGDCPSCRTPAKLGPRSATSKILINITDDLLVRCPKSEDGCKAQVKRGEVQDHVKLYCGHAYMECPADDCEQPIRRKDAGQGCLHFGVSCLDCRQPMQKSTLETHWRSECPDRKINCDLCKEAVFYRERDLHNRETCSAISVPCPGKALGCASRSKRSHAEVHAKSCTLAKLAPMLTGMQQRMDEQEAAQKVMVRKLEVLEGGFQAVQTILSTKQEDPDQLGADESRLPFLTGTHHQGGEGIIGDTELDAFEFPAPSSSSRPSSELVQIHASTTPSVPGPRPVDLPEPFSIDFDMASPFPPPAANGPYISPLHHLLSMHESLRDEMSRMSAALQELDGRQSVQTLNENLRTREEISYIGAQVAGLSRQVHWLTSAQLQRLQQGSGTGAGASMGAAGPSNSDIAGAGAGVEAAVSTAATALRGAARVVNTGQGMTMRRGLSEEGRTKL